MMDEFIACGLCGERVRIRDLPNTTMAECFDCVVRLYYEPPKLPWWKVSCW